MATEKCEGGKLENGSAHKVKALTMATFLAPRLSKEEGSVWSTV